MSDDSGSNTQSESASPRGGSGDEGEISPAEFTKRMPEGQSAGPGAPETVEPTQGSGDAGPGGPAMHGLGRDEGKKSADEDSHADAGGAVGAALREGVVEGARKLTGHTPPEKEPGSEP